MKPIFLLAIAALLQIANAQMLVVLACWTGVEVEMAISSLVVGITGAIEALTAEAVATPVGMVAFEYAGQSVMLEGAAAASVATAEVSIVGGKVAASTTVRLGEALKVALRRPYLINGEKVFSSELTLDRASKLSYGNVEFEGGLSRIIKAANSVKSDY